MLLHVFGATGKTHVAAGLARSLTFVNMPFCFVTPHDDGASGLVDCVRSQANRRSHLFRSWTMLDVMNVPMRNPGEFMVVRHEQVPDNLEELEGSIAVVGDSTSAIETLAALAPRVPVTTLVHGSVVECTLPLPALVGPEHRDAWCRDASRSLAHLFRKVEYDHLS